MPGLLQGGAKLGIELLESPGDAVRHGAGLPADPAAAHVDRDVELLAHLDGEEGRVGLLGKILVAKVVLEFAAVGDQLAGAFNNADPGGGRLAAAGGGKDGGFSAHEWIRLRS